MTFESAEKSKMPHSEKVECSTRPEGESGGNELPRVLRCLFEEHRHLNALMNALERRIQPRVTLTQGDYFLLRDIVAYLHDYPDSVHHPTENLLFEILLERAPSSRKAVAGLRRDHASVAAETQDLIDLLEQAIDEPTEQVEQQVREGCRAFIDHQRNHMRFENLNLFPAAMEALSPQDWKQIEAHFAAVEDPLFGRVVGSRHRLLYEYLAQPAGKAAENFSISRTFSLERLIMAVEVLGKGTDSWCARLKDMGREVSHETRTAVSNTLKPESIGSAIGLPVQYTVALGKSMLDCGGDLFRISTTTAKDALALYTDRNPFD
jgi:hemerythrin-like domain-containing protein